MIIPPVLLKCLFLVPLTIIGVITSYSDIRYGKIRNNHLISCFIYTVILFVLLTCYGLFFINTSDHFYYLLKLLSNGAIAFIVGYLLWYFNLWAAGDAKLFTVYSLLIPLEYYSKFKVPHFPSITLLTDTFLIICLALILKIFFTSLVQFLKRRRTSPTAITQESPNGHLSVKKVLLSTGKLLLTTISFLTIMQFVMFKMNAYQQLKLFDLPVFYLLFFAFTMFFSKWFNKLSLYIYFGGLLSILSFIFIGQASQLISILKTSMPLMIILGVGMQALHNYIDKQEIAPIEVTNLNSGSYLAPQSLQEISARCQGKVHISNLSRSDGLSQTQTKAIKKIFKNDPHRRIYIYRTFPFAPFMFLAFLFIVFYGGSFLNLLVKR